MLEQSEAARHVDGHATGRKRPHVRVGPRPDEHGVPVLHRDRDFTVLATHTDLRVVDPAA